jgi:purine nucleosidase
VTEKVILDTDPGIDDALAILLLAAMPEVVLLGISVTHGNTSMEKCLANTKKIVDLAKFKNLPIVAGASTPLVKELSIAEETHGDTGLGYATLPESLLPTHPSNAADFIIDKVQEFPNEVTLLCIGPMTNIALALLKTPAIGPKVKRIISMGGSIHYPGNATPQSEYNVFCDPESFEIVLRSGINFTLVPLDVTYRCIFTEDHVKRLAPQRKSIKEFIADSTRFYMEFHAQYQDIQGCAINDPLAAALLIAPNLVTYQDYFVEVELSDSKSKAKTIADHYRVSGREPNVRVAMEVDVAAFMDLFIERINTL